MGWGSGTANLPYLVTPQTAIENEVAKNNGIVQSITDNWAVSQIGNLARQVSVAIVFVNSDSGEGYISVDKNEGDRNNLTLWQNGDNLIQSVSEICNNTIVVIHSTGPVLLTAFHDNPNVTAIIWAGLPGQESGNSIADVLYGRVNPGGKLPFTLGSSREEYGADVLYEPNNGQDAPQQQFVEGNFIDYRAFDRANVTPIYEFGFGLSYTTFSYSNLVVERHSVGPYVPTTGLTAPAPVLGNYSKDLADYQFPRNFSRLPQYIYPWLNSTDPKKASESSDYGLPNDAYIPPDAYDSTSQPRIAAGGAPGGNPSLYDVLFTVTATVMNDGPIAGEEVAQLYVSLGGPKDPHVVLRNFQRLSIEPGQTATFVADVTRRDISNWDTESQNWIVTSHQKKVHVGGSSRDLPLCDDLPIE